MMFRLRRRPATRPRRRTPSVRALKRAAPSRVVELDAERRRARRVVAERVERAEREVTERVLGEQVANLENSFLVPMVNRCCFHGIVTLSVISMMS